MDFIDKIREVAARIKHLESMKSEEATKTTLILPFIAALGYDIYNPTEVTPELISDYGVKKGERVDYAILRDGDPIILFECKPHTTDLAKVHASQLYRYFSVTKARFGILTNGLVYQFFADLDEPNKMDEKPFFEFSIIDIKEPQVEELKKFSKINYDLTNILNTASYLKYTNQIKKILTEQIQNPSDELVKLIASKVYNGKITATVKDQFTSLIQQSFKNVIADMINERIKSALSVDSYNKDEVDEKVTTKDDKTITNAPEIVTTEDETSAYLIIKAILAEKISSKRVAIRDVKSYCGILLDDNNRKPLARLYFTDNKKSVGLFDTDKEEFVVIEEIEDIYKLAERLKATLSKYEKK
jgi:hypothetical protein